MVQVGDALRFAWAGDGSNPHMGPFDCVVTEIKQVPHGGKTRTQLWGWFCTRSAAPPTWEKGYMWDDDEYWPVQPHPDPDNFKGECVKWMLTQEVGNAHQRR